MSHRLLGMNPKAHVATLFFPFPFSENKFFENEHNDSCGFDGIPHTHNKDPVRGGYIFIPIHTISSEANYSSVYGNIGPLRNIKDALSDRALHSVSFTVFLFISFMKRSFK